MANGFDVSIKVNKKKLTDYVKDYANQYVKVGFFSDKSSLYPDGESVVSVALKNEYGATHQWWQELNGGEGGYIDIPPRPFFHTAWSKNLDKYKNLVKRYLSRSLNGANLDYEQFLNTLGIVAQQDIKSTIVNWGSPPNSPRTVDVKGFNNPLVRTGHMSESVTWEISDDEI